MRAASRAASSSSRPRASRAASVAECVQPAPWVARTSWRGTGISRCSLPVNRWSTALEPCPPVTNAERLHELGAAAALVTGGHGSSDGDHLFTGKEHLEIPVPRHDVRATHGAGCTHSATLAALLARGVELDEAAREAARIAADAVAHGLV